MKAFLVAALLATLSPYASSADRPSVSLGKALAALEHAHTTHSSAMQLCGVKTEREIGWDSIERETRELANALPEPRASEMTEVLRRL